MNKENIQTLGTLVLGRELVLQLLIRAEILPDATLLLVALNVVQLDEPAEDHGESSKRDQCQIAFAVVGLVVIRVDAGGEDGAHLDRHVVQAE